MPRDTMQQRVTLGGRGQDEGSWISAGGTRELCWYAAPAEDMIVGKRVKGLGPEQGQV